MKLFHLMKLPGATFALNVQVSAHKIIEYIKYENLHSKNGTAYFFRVKTHSVQFHP